MSMVVVYRYPLPVRICHWGNTLAFVMLLMSGFQISTNTRACTGAIPATPTFPPFSRFEVTRQGGERLSSLQS